MYVCMFNSTQKLFLAVCIFKWPWTTAQPSRAKRSALLGWRRSSELKNKRSKIKQAATCFSQKVSRLELVFFIIYKVFSGCRSAFCAISLLDLLLKLLESYNWYSDNMYMYIHICIITIYIITTTVYCILLLHICI